MCLCVSFFVFVLSLSHWVDTWVGPLGLKNKCSITSFRSIHSFKLFFAPFLFCFACWLLHPPPHPHASSHHTSEWRQHRQPADLDSAQVLETAIMKHEERMPACILINTFRSVWSVIEYELNIHNHHYFMKPDSIRGNWTNWATVDETCVLHISGETHFSLSIYFLSNINV